MSNATNCTTCLLSESGLAHFEVSFGWDVQYKRCKVLTVNCIHYHFILITILFIE